MKGEIIHLELDVLEADLDDESPQVLGWLSKKLFDEGALDSTLTPNIMKKGRPGTRIEVLCHPSHRDKFVRLLLTETSTLGVKARRIDRYSLEREVRQVEYQGHTIRIKLAWLENKILKYMPEYEDCRVAAEELKIPLRQVMIESRVIARDSIEEKPSLETPSDS